jgi:hypothetical protein
MQGGGIYIQNEPPTLTNSIIARNVPDPCSGC